MIRQILLGYDADVITGTRSMRPTPEEPPEDVPVWTLRFVDRMSGDTVEWSCGRETRDEIVKQLTGGIVLAGGELPRVPFKPPQG